MPIEPIDLQVLFSRMLDVGKEVGVQNNLVSVAQSMQAGELIRQTEVQSSSVNETRETSEVKPAGQGGSHAGQGETEEETKARKKKSGPKSSFQDPDLGRNIDIVG